MADPKNGMSFVGRAELREAELNQFQKIMGVVDDLPALLRGVRGWQKPAAVGTGVWIGGKWYPNKKKQEGEYQYESMTRRGKLREASLIPIEGRLSKVWRSIKGAAARSTKYVKGRASDIAEPVKRFGRTVGGGAALVGLGGLGAVVMPMASDPQEESDRICRRAMLCEAGGFYAERLKNVVEPFMANRTAQLRRRMKAQPEFAKIVGETGKEMGIPPQPVLQKQMVGRVAAVRQGLETSANNARRVNQVSSANKKHPQIAEQRKVIAQQTRKARGAAREVWEMQKSHFKAIHKTHKQLYGDGGYFAKRAAPEISLGNRDTLQEESDRICRRALLCEALSEKRRKKVKKSQFVAPGESREGHSDKGLFPVFDTHSAHSAQRLKHTHPELAHAIDVKCAKFGVGPLAKGAEV